MKNTLLIVVLMVFGLVSFAQKVAPSTYSQSTETLPHFKGGEVAFYRYLDKHVKLPEGFDAATYLKENHNQYVPVTVGFTVDVDGSIVDVKVMENTNPLLAEKAKKIIANMPKWVPGTLEGEPVKVQYAIPVRFNLM